MNSNPISIVIPSTEASNLSVSQLKEYIKNNPSVLDLPKKENKKEDAKNENMKEKENVKNENMKAKENVKVKDVEKKSNVINVFYNDKEEEEDDDDKDEDDEEEYVSKKEIEIEKLQDTIRYLKLDLNNEQVKNDELTKESIVCKYYSKLIHHISDSTKFLEYKSFSLKMDYLSGYNVEIIRITKLYHVMESSYRELMKSKNELYTQFSELNLSDFHILHLLNYFESQIRLKFDELHLSYQRVNKTLTSFSKKMEMMKYLIIFLFLSNLYFIFKK